MNMTAAIISQHGWAMANLLIALYAVRALGYLLVDKGWISKWSAAIANSASAIIVVFCVIANL